MDNMLTVITAAASASALATSDNTKKAAAGSHYASPALVRNVGQTALVAVFDGRCNGLAQPKGWAALLSDLTPFEFPGYVRCAFQGHRRIHLTGTGSNHELPLGRKFRHIEEDVLYVQ